MWFVTIWQLMWEMWTSAPQCEASCSQGRQTCTCKGPKHG